MPMLNGRVRFLRLFSSSSRNELTDTTGRTRGYRSKAGICPKLSRYYGLSRSEVVQTCARWTPTISHSTLLPRATNGSAGVYFYFRETNEHTEQTPGIPPAIALQGIRSYPLRAINEPAMYVLGEKAGQKVLPQATSGVSTLGAPGAMPGSGMAVGMQNQTHDATGAGFGLPGASGAHAVAGHVGAQGHVPGAASTSAMGMGMSGTPGMNMNLPMGVAMNPRLQQMMIAQQNREMEALERRAAAQQQQHPQHVQAHGHGHPQAIPQHTQTRAAPVSVLYFRTGLERFSY